MNFSAWSIRNPIAPLLGFALLPILWTLLLSFRPTTHLFEPIWDAVVPPCPARGR